MIAVYGLAAVLFSATPMNDGMRSMCSEHQGLDVLEGGGAPASLIRDVCDAKLSEYSGVFAIVEDKHLPIPSAFFIDSDNPRYRLAMLPRDELIADPDWPYTKLIIGSLEESPSRIEKGHVEVTYQSIPFGSVNCNFDLSVNSYAIYLDDGNFFQHATELRLSQSVVVIFGGGPNLVRAMSEAFVRINCPS